MREAIFVFLVLIVASDGFFFGSPESPYSDSDCDPPFSQCVAKSACPWHDDRESSARDLENEEPTLALDLKIELIASQCNQEKVCCPVAANYYCDAGYDLTFDRAICSHLYEEPAYSAPVKPAYEAPKPSYGAPAAEEDTQGNWLTQLFQLKGDTATQLFQLKGDLLKGGQPTAAARNLPLFHREEPEAAAPSPGYGAPKPSYAPSNKTSLPYPVPCCDGRPYVCEAEEECSAPSYGSPGPQFELFMQGHCEGADGGRIPAPCCGAPRPEYKPSYEAGRRRSNGKRARRSSATGAGSFVKPPKRQFGGFGRTRQAQPQRPRQQPRQQQPQQQQRQQQPQQQQKQEIEQRKPTISMNDILTAPLPKEVKEPIQQEKETKEVEVQEGLEDVSATVEVVDLKSSLPIEQKNQEKETEEVELPDGLEDDSPIVEVVDTKIEE